MLTIGCHLSSSKGYLNMGQEALNIKANTFQFFTRNPRGSKAKAIDPIDVQNFLNLMQKNDFSCILAHAPYTMNPCSQNEKTRQFAWEIMADDLKRLEFTPQQYYNFHPGSHTGQGIKTGIQQITEMLNHLIKPEQTTTVLLETMAGKGTEVGSCFEELAEILAGVKLKNKMGICLDTCHIFDAGYDLVNNLDEVLAEFDSIIGLEKLKAIHLNDSKNPLASHKDRHECLGAGYIGLKTLQTIVNHPQLKDIPFYLETPNDLAGYAQEIEMIKKSCQK